MLKRMLVTWLVANFALVGLVSWLAGGWYLGWPVSPVLGALAELGLIMVPNFVLPALALRYWWPESIDRVRDALGWRWAGWRSLVSGLVAFAALYALLHMVVSWIGGSIPYHLPGTEEAGSAMTIGSVADLLRALGLLLALLGLVSITVVGEETMFRGFIQTQLGKRYGVWAGIVVGALMFGLRHLPADLFYARVWQATPQMWLSRQLQLYLTAICLSLARHLGKSTYASAITHGLVFAIALFGPG